jgi:hypothetical protein
MGTERYHPIQIKNNVLTLLHFRFKAIRRSIEENHPKLKEIKFGFISI